VAAIVKLANHMSADEPARACDENRGQGMPFRRSSVLWTAILVQSRVRSGSVSDASLCRAPVTPAPDGARLRLTGRY
jgi:hypothetical protein